MKDSDTIVHAENTVHNLTLDLSYAILNHPGLFEELDETFDGMPGFSFKTVMEPA